MGIFLDGMGVTGCTIINNNVSNNGGFGIFACWANDNNISNNLFIFNGRNGIRVDVSRNILTHNIVNYNGWLGTYEGSGIHLYVAFDCLIERNTASNNRQSGIDVQGMSSNITIEDNTAENNGYDGIFHYGSLACSTEANTISNNGHNGIFIEFSNDNTISHNTITSNNWNGIFLSTSDGNKIYDNIATNNYVGIRLDRPDGNTIRGNTVKNNRGGIYPWTSNNNMIFHNDFINNTKQANVAGLANIWDDGYPSGGNYWSDYIVKGGYDADGDGIGDIPYIIDINNRDRYPLMEPWSIPTMIKTLIRTIGFSDLPKGTENSLTAKLEGALHLLDIGKENGAIHKLMDFINQVKALRGKKLPSDKADCLISEAQRIIDLINE